MSTHFSPFTTPSQFICLFHWGKKTLFYTGPSVHWTVYKNMANSLANQTEADLCNPQKSSNPAVHASKLLNL